MIAEKKSTIRFITTMVYIMLFWLLLFYVLTTFRNFLSPIALGILFAYLLYPIASFLEKKGAHRIFANLAAIFVGIFVLYTIIFFLYRELRSLMNDLPTLEMQALKNMNEAINQVTSFFSASAEYKETNVRELISELFSRSGENMGQFLGATAQTFFTIFIMPVYIFFLLYYRNKYFYFVLMLIPPKSHPIAEKTLREISKVIRQYMTGVSKVVLILIVLNSLGLFIIGVKYALLMGIIAALCNFIPYFGTIIGYFFPLAMALFTGDGPQQAVGVVILFIIIQFTENNILTPNITGGEVKVNPFFIILGVLIGGFVWGVPGMFIVVPVMAAARITFENIPELMPWAYLISDAGTERYALSLYKFKRYFSKFTKSK